MLRVAVPYGELSSRQLRQLARIAREHDLQDAGRPTERGGFGHFSTRQNLQFNWIPLTHSADVMDLLAEVDMHGIQTSGNCIRNITTDALAGIAPDETVDPRPYAEMLRQWSTLHPEFAFLPRKFKIAITGARKTAPPPTGTTSASRCAATPRRGGLSRRGGRRHGPHAARRHRIPGLVPWQQILVYIEAVVRVYNLYGRRDNQYKSRIKILVKAEGQRFVETVNARVRGPAGRPGTPLLPAGRTGPRVRRLRPATARHRARCRRSGGRSPCPPSAAGCSATCMRTACPATAR
jgi:sulfite reductase (NADPH) hemoprotein beta-component